MSPLAILGIIVAVAAVIAVISFCIHKYLSLSLKKDNEKPTEEEASKEEMNRLLQDVEDEEISKAINEYKQDDENK